MNKKEIEKYQYMIDRKEFFELLRDMIDLFARLTVVKGMNQPIEEKLKMYDEYLIDIVIMLETGVDRHE